MSYQGERAIALDGKVADQLTAYADSVGRDPRAILNAIICRSLNQLEATSEPDARFDPGSVVVMRDDVFDSFLLVLYQGRLAGLGVVIREPDAARPRTVTRGYFELKGKMLMDWSPWFEKLFLRATGKEISQCF